MAEDYELKEVYKLGIFHSMAKALYPAALWHPVASWIFDGRIGFDYES